MLGRLVADGLSKALGVNVTPENKPGATGAIGSAEVARSRPDGHTLLLGFDGTIAIAPVIQANVGFDPLKDFSPISRLADVGLVVAVHPSIPARDMRQLIEWAKANPGKLSFASPGPGSTAHLAGEQFLPLAGGGLLAALVAVPWVVWYFRRSLVDFARWQRRRQRSTDLQNHRPAVAWRALPDIGRRRPWLADHEHAHRCLPSATQGDFQTRGGREWIALRELRLCAARSEN